MVGLQGSGKTDQRREAGALAKPERSSVDAGFHRRLPSCRAESSCRLSPKRSPHSIHRGEGVDDPLQLCREALREAANSGCDVLLIDTAGRLHVDEQLMEELRKIKELVNPSEVLFVADAMTGQDAVKSAQEFHDQLGVTGVVLTKLDGDARGGAALSIKAVTGQAIKFVGVGEKYDALELFHPDRLVSRILGMGDVLSLIEKAEEAIDQKQAVELERKLRTDSFTLEDFRDQLRQMRKLGPLEQILGMLPQVGPFKDLTKVKVDEKELVHIEAIINSMTPRERTHHQIINGSRRKRIARGSGTSVQQVNQLLKQYVQARKMMKQMSSGMFGKRFSRMRMPNLG